MYKANVSDFNPKQYGSITYGGQVKEGGTDERVSEHAQANSGTNTLKELAPGLQECDNGEKSRMKELAQRQKMTNVQLAQLVERNTKHWIPGQRKWARRVVQEHAI